MLVTYLPDVSIWSSFSSKINGFFLKAFKSNSLLSMYSTICGKRSNMRFKSAYLPTTVPPIGTW